jgi:exosome complex component RRP46
MFVDGGGVDDKPKSDCVWSSWKSVVGGYDESELFRAREMARVSAVDVYLAMKKSIEEGQHNIQDHLY